MIRRMPAISDETCPSCVVAGDYIFLAHHGGGLEVNDIAHQVRAIFERMKKTLATVNATLDDVVQLNFYIKNIDDFDSGREVFFEYFKNGFPARMTVITKFLDEEILCQIDGIAYKPVKKL
jgi:2-iminobutanoate/2-iminopropanoate deaminase